MPGRTLAIGDVHGCHRALVELLGMFAVTAADTVVFLGDVVDRGPATRQVVEEILSLANRAKVVCLMGNHEEMMRDAISGRGLFNAWLDVGGKATLDSYGGAIENIPPAHLRFLVSTRPYYETDTDIFVHASLEPEVSLANQTALYLRWKHLAGNEFPHISGKRVICGHTPQSDGAPLVFHGWVCLDTLAHGAGWLTALDVGTGEVFQAAADGKTRTFPLSRYA